ncbi:TldD/PmbA family protein [Bacteriovorax sp. Seq25_V]|uniref:TldD/PmbA family protein n=1 Tax=Bacteriovorax sp. Seq25_V TaxID=1201288 RepID=UPI0004003CFD|nr:TldD/PmbA family protein [Bacteriovorax sp. Seq25_V]
MINYIDKTIKFANELGAKECDVIVSGQDTFSLKADKGELGEYKKANSHSLGIRVIQNGKVGTSFTEALDDDSIKETIKKALENAKYSKEDPHQRIVAKGNSLSDKNPKANIEHSPTPDEMIEKALYLENEVLKREKLATNAPYNSVSEGTVQVHLGNSLGVRCSYQAKTYSCFTSALLKDGDKNSMHYKGSVKRDFRELDFDDCIDESIEVAKNLLHAGQLPTGDYNVSFSPDLFQDIFGSFALMLSAKGAIDKINPWKDKIGQKVIDERISFIDDPFYEKGFNVMPFDSEGFNKQKNTFVENGVLKSFIHNSATASELGATNNFCASRGPKSSLSTTFSNFIIETGPDSEAKLKDIDYIEITNAQGLHSGTNSISGEFSLGVSGRVYKNGEIVSYFKDVTVSGNFYKILGDVLFVGDKLHNTSDYTFFMPTIIFNSLSIAGK